MAELAFFSSLLALNRSSTFVKAAFTVLFTVAPDNVGGVVAGGCTEAGDGAENAQRVDRVDCLVAVDVAGDGGEGRRAAVDGEMRGEAGEEHREEQERERESLDGLLTLLTVAAPIMGPGSGRSSCCGYVWHFGQKCVLRPPSLMRRISAPQT